MDRIAQGGTVTLTAEFQSGTGDLTDPVGPKVDIIDADGGQLVTDATPTRLSLGHWTYVYSVPGAGPVGVWQVHWSGTIDGVDAGGDDWFQVVVPGDLSVLKAYTTLANIKDYMGIPGSNADVQLTSALNAASRSIDNYCHRRFYADPTLTSRTFASPASFTLELDDGIGSLAGLVVKTDPVGDGTYATTWAATDYQLLPVNAPNAFPEAEPWTALQAVGALRFPTGWWGRTDRVQITARWGWPAVPDAVVQACLIKAAALFHRKDSPQGVAGFGDFGPVRLSRREDADVCNLLDPYRWLLCA